MKIETRELTPELWPVLEELFGKNGACGGCWCMYWRTDKGERYDDIKGAEAKRRFKALVEAGRAHGILAFSGGEAVGWCAFERRVELLKLNRAPSLACDDAQRVWSLPCFFVKRQFRGKGVAQAMLHAAVKALRARGAKVAEGYPTLPSRSVKIPGPWAYTGVPSLFEKEGFTIVDKRPQGKQRYRKSLGR